MWHVAYKRNGTLRMHSCIIDFGCGDSSEELMAKVRARIEGDPHFKDKHRGGHFVAVYLQDMIQVGAAEYLS